MRLNRIAVLALAATMTVAARPEPPIDAKLDRAEQMMMAEPASVLPIVRDVQRQIAASGSFKSLAGTRAVWLQGEALGRLNDTAAADALTARALALVLAIQPNGKLHGRILMSRGAVALDQGKVQNAFSDFQRAYSIFRRNNDARDQALALQNIGSIYSDAGDQQDVLRYYAQSAEVYSGDPSLSVVAHNNLGLAYKEMGDLARAEDEYDRALAIAAKVRSPLLEARIDNNLGAVLLARGKYAAASAVADRGLRLARLGGATDWMPFLWGLKAQIAFAQGDAPGAVALFERAFADTDLAKTNFYYRDFHETAVNAYLAVGDKDKAIRHLRALKRLDDQAREIRSSTNAALLAARFDFSNQALKISRLQATQLKQDVAIGRARARLNAIVLAAALLLLAATLAGFFSVRRSRNQTRDANVKLGETNTKLDQALRAKSEFLATTSHEIRTPLNGILGMTQVLLSGRAMTEEVRERVGLIDIAGNTMKAIVDDILDMAKIEAGRVTTTEEPFDLRELLEQVGALWAGTAAEKSLDLAIALDEAPGRVIGDGRKVRQITYNLLSNAIKFTDMGQVSFSAQVSPTPSGEEVAITVSDTGVGIPADQLEAVFSPFHQVNGSTTRKVGGTGLGLAISRNLAEAIGGRVTVNSEPDVGSTFTLTLPVRRAVEPPAVSTLPERADTLAQARVLVLEANPLLQSVLSAFLKGRVGALTLVSSLDEAKSALADDQPHLIAIDLASVGGGGAELDEWLADCSGRPVLLLADPANASGDDCVDRGLARAVLAKALPPLQLPGALERLLLDDVATNTAAAA